MVITYIQGKGQAEITTDRPMETISDMLRERLPQQTTTDRLEQLKKQLLADQGRQLLIGLGKQLLMDRLYF